MKKFIAVIIAVIALTASVIASDYVLVKNGEKITIHKITIYSNNSTDVSTSEFVNPTVSQLSDIGLPSYYWSFVNGEDGAYDTRLTKATQDYNDMKTNYENEVEYTNSLEEKNDWHVLYHLMLVLVIIVALVVLIAKQQQIYKLKKK